MRPVDEFAATRVARTFRVPYWLVTSEPRPSWLRSPWLRARALWWRYRG